MVRPSSPASMSYSWSYPTYHFSGVWVIPPPPRSSSPRRTVNQYSRCFLDHSQMDTTPSQFSSLSPHYPLYFWVPIPIWSFLHLLVPAVLAGQWAQRIMAVLAVQQPKLRRAGVLDEDALYFLTVFKSLFELGHFVTLLFHSPITPCLVSLVTWNSQSLHMIS